MTFCYRSDSSSPAVQQLCRGTVYERVRYSSAGHKPTQVSLLTMLVKPSVSDSMLTLKVLVTTIDAQWEGMGDVGLARYEPALLPPCPTIRVLSYSN